MNYRYSLWIQWSEEDQLYLVTIPEFAEMVMQPCTSGKTYEDAVANAQEALLTARRSQRELSGVLQRSRH